MSQTLFPFLFSVFLRVEMELLHVEMILFSINLSILINFTGNPVKNVAIVTFNGGIIA